MFKFMKQLKNTEISMKIKEHFFPDYPKAQFLFAMERYRTCDSVKKKSQMRKEISLYKKFWKCFPYDYFLSDLYRLDNQLSQEKINNYIPGFFWYYLYCPHHTSYRNSQIIDNKLLTERFFKSLNISQPDTLCLVINKNLYSEEMKKSTFYQIIQEIARKNPEKIFVKPASGGGAQGIEIFNRTSGGSYRTRGNRVFDENFVSAIGKKSDYIIQAGVIQDPGMSSIYPESVNTCRIVTENKDGNTRVVCGMLRVGRGHLEIDNVSHEETDVGGLCTKIDIRNGALGDYAMSYEYEKFEEHPDTHYLFKNNKIPHWEEIEKFANDSAAKLPLFTHLGWDIALTREGPLAIEPNISVGIEALQIANGGLRESFDINDPVYYWKNPGKRI